MNKKEDLKSKILKEFSEYGIRLFTIGHQDDKHYFQIFYNPRNNENGIGVKQAIIKNELRKVYGDNASLTMLNTDQLPENIEHPDIEVVYDKRWLER